MNIINNDRMVLTRNDDCLGDRGIKYHIAPNSIDAIITDLPYGTTRCKWDEILPFDDMWAAFKYVLKPTGVVVTTCN